MSRVATIILVLAGIFAVAMAAEITQITPMKTPNVCNTANFDYDVESTLDGYRITFTDLTKNGFIAFANIIWSTTIPHPTDPLGSHIPSKEEKIRLKKSGQGHWQQLLDISTIINSIDKIDAPSVSSLDDKLTNEVKLRFFFEFWSIDEDGNNQLCNSPWIVV